MAGRLRRKFLLPLIHRRKGRQQVRKSLAAGCYRLLGKDEPLYIYLAECMEHYAIRSDGCPSLMRSAIEHGTPEQREMLLDPVVGLADTWATDPRGVRVLRAAFEFGTPDQREQLATEKLLDDAVALALDPSGRVVVECALSFGPDEVKDSVVEAICTNAEKLAVSDDGWAVLRRVLEVHASPDQLDTVYGATADGALTLGGDSTAAGGLVAWALEYAPEEQRKQLIASLSNPEGFASLADEEHGVATALSVLALSGSEQVAMIQETVVKNAETWATSDHGSRVVLRAHETGTQEQRDSLEAALAHLGTQGGYHPRVGEIVDIAAAKTVEHDTAAEAESTDTEVDSGESA